MTENINHTTALSRAQNWARLFALLVPGLLFLLVLVILPLGGWTSSLKSMTSGPFREFNAWQLFWGCLAFLCASGSLMLCQGLLMEEDQNLEPNHHTKALKAWLDAKHLYLWQVLFYTIVVAGPGILVITMYAEGVSIPVRVALIMVGLGIAYSLLGFFCAAAKAATNPDSEEPFEMFNSLPGSGCVDRLAKWEPLKRGASAFRSLAEWVIRSLGLKPILPALFDSKDRLAQRHFFAFLVASGLFLIMFAVGTAFDPKREWGNSEYAPPAIAYVYIAISFLVWIWGFLAFHFARLRFSPVLILLVVAFATYGALDLDHAFPFSTRESDNMHRLPPKAVLPPANQSNLVIVTATGGGIHAAGWCAMALEKMYAERPQLTNEIRLISAVSGGSVGTAHALLALHAFHSTSNSPPLSELLGQARTNSVKSSLTAFGYGLAFRDLPCLTGLGALPYLINGDDRGSILERSWSKTGTIRLGNPLDVCAGFTNLGDLRLEIASGKLPAPIFNATVMETGDRVMITPVEFPAGHGNRPRTLDHWIRFEGNDRRRGDEKRREVDRLYADLSYWTGPRISAAFAYISPAVRPRGVLEVWEGTPDPAAGTDGTRAAWRFADKPTEQSSPSRYHFIDGGYSDNYGVGSALEWIYDEVLPNATNGLRRILLVQLRSFSCEALAQPESGIKAALLGPLLGADSIRDRNQITQNDMAVRRLRDFVGSLNDGRRFESIVLECRADQTPPLNWHMTQREIKELWANWEAKGVLRVRGGLYDGSTRFSKAWGYANDYLEGKDANPKRK